MLKKIFVGGMLSAIAGTFLFASTPSVVFSKQKTIVTSYITYIDYSKTYNHKKVLGTTLQTSVGANKLFADLKYVYFNAKTEKPHKWDLSVAYKIKELPVLTEIGGKLTQYYINSRYNPGYTVFAGIFSKNFSPDVRAKIGTRVYFTNFKHLVDGQKAYQADFIAIGQPTKTSIGKIFMTNTISYVKLEKNNFDGESHYISDNLTAKIVQENMLYFTGIHFGKTAYNINAGSKFFIDTSGTVNKWGVLFGAGYKINKKSSVMGKIQYSKIDTFNADNATETKYSVAYNLTF